jgi:heme exporter protein D
MKSLAEFLAMGGYAVYVWSSYALAVVVLIGNAVHARQRERRLLQTLAGRTRRRQAS